MKRLLAIILCLSLLLGAVTVLAEGSSLSTPRTNVTDTDPPEIVQVIVKENKKALKPGDVLHVQMRLDDRSYISNVYVEFYNSTKGGWLSLTLFYDPTTDMFTGERTIQKSDLNGSYVLSYISIQDEYNNSLSLSKGGKDFGSFKIGGATSSTGVKGTAKIKENGKTIKPGDSIHVDVKLKKALAAANYAEAVFRVEGRDNVSHWYWLDKKSSKAFSGQIWFDKNCLNGKWVLETIYIYDEYSTTIGELKVSGQSVTFQGGSSDKTPPAFTSVTLKEKKKTLKPGDTVHVSLKVKDKSSVDYVYATFDDKEPVFSWDDTAKSYKSKSKYGIEIPLKYNKSSKKWEGSAVLPEYLPNGKYKLYVSAWDLSSNYGSKSFDNLYFTFNSPDYVDSGISSFLTECWYAIWGKDPTDSELQQYGMPLASGKQKAADVIKALVTKAGLTGESAAEALWRIMQGEYPGDKDLANTVSALKTGLEYAIDSLNNTTFRELCNYWGIKPGGFGTKAADIELASVDADGGHYTLNGGKATLTGVTDKGIKALVIPDTVSANGKTYKVTKIEALACAGLSKLASVTIGKNVTAIDHGAFKDCKKLKTITVNAAKLKTVGTNAFSGINSKATFKCPKKQLSKYKDLFLKKGGAPKGAKFK